MARNVPLSTSVPKIYVPSLSTKRIYVPHIKAKHLATPFKSTATPRSVERRHVKDLGDIFLGDPFYGTRQLRETLEDEADWANYVPILNRIVGVGIMARERFLEPLADGKPGVALINTLESLGSSLDVLANPVKSLMPWAGGGDESDLFKSMGWLDDSYRETYQWSTGNFLVDLVGEIVSDPTNWLTLGGKSTLKLTGVTDDVLRMTDNALIKTFGAGSDELVSTLPKATKLNIITDAADDIVDSNGKIIKSLRKHITEKKSRALIQRNKFTKGSKHYKEADEMFKTYSKMARLDKFDILEKELANLRMSKEYKWYNSITKAIRIGEATDRALMTATEVVLPQIGFSHVLIKYGIVPTYKALHNKMVMDLKDYPLEDIMKNPTKAVKYLKENIGLHDDIANKETYLKMLGILKNHGLDVNKIHDMWMNLYYDTPVVQRTNLVQLRKQFVNRLIKEIPVLKTFKDMLHTSSGTYVLNEAQLSILKSYKLTIKDIASFIDSIMARGTTMVDVDILVPRIYKQGVDTMYNLFKKRHVDEYNVIKEVLKNRMYHDIKINKPAMNALVDLTNQLERSYEVIYQLKYIDDQFLRIDNKRYGLKHLKQFLKDSYKQDPERAKLARDLLNYYGVTVNNADYIIDTINSLDNIIKSIEQARLVGHYTMYKQLNEELADEYLRLLDKLKASQSGVYVTIDSLERASKSGINLFKSSNGKLYEDVRKNPFRKWLKEYIRDPQNNAIKPEYFDKTSKVDLDSYSSLRRSLFDALGMDYRVIEDYNNEILRWKNYGKDTWSNTVDSNFDDLPNLDAFINEHMNRDVADWLIINTYELDTINKNIRKTYTPFEILTSYIDLEVLTEGTVSYADKALPDITMMAKGITEFQEHLKTISANAKDIPKSIEKFISLDLKPNGFSTKFKTLYKDIVDLRKNIQSKYSMFTTIMGYIHKLDDFSDYYTQLSLPDSPIRQSLEAAIAHLMYQTDEVSQRTSAYLRELIAKVDASNVLENTLNTIELPAILHTIGGGQAIEDAINVAVKDLFYSTIYEFRRSRTSTVYDITQSLINKFMNNFDRNIKPAITKMLEQGEVKYIPEGETIDTILSLAIQQFKSTVRMGFEDYSQAMLRISYNTGLDLPYMYVLDNRAVNVAQQLKEDYADIMNTMLGYNTHQESVHSLIQNFAGGVAQDITDDVLNFFKAQADKVGSELHGALNLDINLDQKYMNSFKTAMFTAYNEIYAVNNELSKSLGKIGRTGYFKGVAKKVTQDTVYLTVDTLNRWALENIFVDNAYALSLFTSTTAKKVNPKYVIDSIISLDLLNPKISDNEYKLLVETYQTSKVKVKSYSNLRDDMGEVYKKALTKFFSEPRANWGPKDPETYFKHLSTEDLYIWNDMVRGRSLHKHNITYVNLCKDYTNALASSRLERLVPFTYELDELQYNLDYATNPKLFIDTIDGNVTDFTKLHDDNVWGPMSVTAANYQLDQLFDRVEESLYRTIKDPKSLQQHQQALIEHQKRGVSTINNLRTLVKLERDTRLVKDVVKDEEALKVLRGFNITPEMPMNSKAVLKYMTDETHQMFKNNFLNFTPKQVRKYLEDYTIEGKLIYINTELNKAPFEDLAALKDAGVGLVKDDRHPGVFMLYTLSGEYETENINWSVYKSIFPHTKRTIVKAITDSQQTYTWGTIDVPYELFDGLVLYRKQYDTIMKSELFSKLSQKALHFSPVLGLNNSIKNSIGLPNFTIIGGTNSYMTALDLAEDVFKRTGSKRVYPMYYSKAITRRITHGLLNAVHTQDQKIKYLSLFLNEDYSLGGPLFRRVFANADDKSIEDVFSRNNFVAAIVKQDKKGQPKIYKINVTNKKQLADAIDAKAIVLPHEVYRNMVLTINDYKFDNKFMQVYERTIMFAYKTIYLSHVGTLMRNAIDSMAVKPALSTDGLASITAHFEYQYQATKLLDWYNKIHEEVFDLTDGMTFNRRALAKVLKNYSAEERYWYAIVDTFVNSSASGGNSEAMMAFWKKYNFDRAGYSGFPWEKYIADAVAESPRVQWVQSMNNHIEQSARLGMLLYQLDNGYNIPAAIRNIISTHFDYALKDDAGYLLERLFWFSTFSINNLMYYVNIGLTKNPNILDAYMDALELSWNDGEDYTWDEVKDNPYLTYWATLGHLRFRWGDDKDLIFKTGSSFIDFFSIIFGLNQEFQERLNPFLSVLLGFEPLQNINPWAADISYGKQIIQGRSLVPSVYTTINRYKDYKKKHKIEKRPYISSTSSWRTYPKRLPNRRVKLIRNRFAYTRNWRQYTRYFHRNSNPPQWTYRNSRQHHIASRYIRNQKIRI